MEQEKHDLTSPMNSEDFNIFSGKKNTQPPPT